MKELPGSTYGEQENKDSVDDKFQRHGPLSSQQINYHRSYK